MLSRTILSQRVSRMSFFISLQYYLTIALVVSFPFIAAYTIIILLRISYPNGMRSEISDIYRNGSSLIVVKRLLDIKYPLCFPSHSRETCIICLETMRTYQRVRRFDCGHFFHNHCIIAWLRMQDTCPTCRMRVF